MSGVVSGMSCSCPGFGLQPCPGCPAGVPPMSSCPAHVPPMSRHVPPLSRPCPARVPPCPARVPPVSRHVPRVSRHVPPVSRLCPKTKQVKLTYTWTPFCCPRDFPCPFHVPPCFVSVSPAKAATVTLATRQTSKYLVQFMRTPALGCRCKHKVAKSLNHIVNDKNCDEGL